MLAVALDDRLDFQLVHHGLADFVRGLAPDVDDLVVALAGGDQTRGVLLLDLLHFRFGGRDHALLASGTSMSSTAIEIPARVARRKPDCISLSANTTVARRPHLRNDVLISLRDLLLLQRAVQHRERQAFRQDLGQDRTADGGLVAGQGLVEFALRRSSGTRRYAR